MMSYGRMVMILLCRDFLLDEPQPADVDEVGADELCGSIGLNTGLITCRDEVGK